MFMGCLVLERLFGNRISQGMRYGALKIALFFYLIPWGLLPELCSYIAAEARNERIAAAPAGLAEIGGHGEAYGAGCYGVLLLIAAVWLGTALLLMAVRMSRFLKMDYSLRFLAVECGDGNLEEALDRLQKEKLYSRKVRIAWTRRENETITVGVIEPIIFLQKKYAEGDLYRILKHELIHVARRDLLVKYLMEFACCLHWPNPLIRMLNHRLVFACETSCDERVLRGCGKEECRAYAFLLDAGRRESCARAPEGCSLKKFNEDVDRRIELIMEGTKTEGGQK